MGLFNKLKNVLFEEEEIEVPVEEPKKKNKNDTIQKVDKKTVKMTFDDEEEIANPIASDRELFKAEKTFDFPVFDDQEFEDMKVVPNKKAEDKEPPKSMSINLFDYEKPKMKEHAKMGKKAQEIKGRAYSKQRKEDNASHKFRPSPVISPVYGVLDKNYKKEDITIEPEETKKIIDVDDVRKKAFGTLEEDIEKTLSKPFNDFYEEEPITTHSKKKKKEPEKTIEDLLEETAFDTIELETTKKEKTEEQIKPIDIPKEKSEEEKLTNDTLENDLFDLIDSMYENREEE